MVLIDLRDCFVLFRKGKYIHYNKAVFPSGQSSMQSKSINDRADDQGTSRSVRLTAQTIDGSSSTTETQNNPVTNALARLEGVIETKISTLKRDIAIENEENLARMAKNSSQPRNTNLNTMVIGNNTTTSPMSKKLYRPPLMHW